MTGGIVWARDNLLNVLTDMYSVTVYVYLDAWNKLGKVEICL